ncbi:S1C family serine protease [[Phormidium] sp. ETS-05]|uniref:S1C family serine protease n=1 Tax=[Phormidium] sp. ETS-05 TaxID=222819 RepID=UPI0018EF17E1|nr:trypsin-like peptidase domain-containing protein [[Phormidium] sp. ETS-05]
MPSLSALQTLSNDISSTIETVGSSVVAVHGRSRINSSGVHWQSGIIVTGEHTLKKEEDIPITLPSGVTTTATFVGRDATTDIAVLKLPQDIQLPTANIGDASELKVGHLILAVGHADSRGIIASMGTVSASSGPWRSMLGGAIDQFLRLDINLSPDQEGGPLVDTAGHVCGINTPGPRGTVLAIPAATVNRVVAQLLAKGRIVRGYLGVGMQPVIIPDHLKQKLSLTSNGGVIVVSVEANCAADKAGITIGDVLVELDNRPITDIRDVQAVLDPDSVGKTINARLIRGGQVLTASIQVLARNL